MSNSNYRRPIPPTELQWTHQASVVYHRVHGMSVSRRTSGQPRLLVILLCPRRSYVKLRPQPTPAKTNITIWASARNRNGPTCLVQTFLCWNLPSEERQRFLLISTLSPYPSGYRRGTWHFHERYLILQSDFLVIQYYTPGTYKLDETTL